MSDIEDQENNDKQYIEDAKNLSITFLITGMAVLILATFLGFMERSVQSGLVSYSSRLWYTLMTLHGMMAFVGFGVFTSLGLVWYPLVKSLDKPLFSTILPKVSYFSFAIGFLMIIISTLFGDFAGSWVFLFPLPFFGGWPLWATTVWTLGVLLAGVGIIVAQVEVLLTVKISAGHSLIAALGFSSFKPEPEDGYKVPLAVVPFTVNALGMIIATIPFAVLLLIFIFQSLNFVSVSGLDALIAKNTLWWFGHPVVYALLFPIAGFAYYMVGRITNTDKLIGDRISRLTWAIAVVIQNIVGSHHVYQDLVQPLPITISQQLLTYVITLPSVSSIFVIMGTLWAKEFEWSIEVKYLYLAALGWLLAGMSGVVNATILLNTYVHNSLWVVAHFHTMALLNITMMIFGISYFLVQDFGGNDIFDRKLAEWGMWLKYIGTVGFVHMWFVQGILGGLRRVKTSSPGNGLLTILSIPFALMILIGIWISVYNLYKTGTGATPTKEPTPTAASGD